MKMTKQDQIIKLLEENNRILKNISEQLSSAPSAGMGIGMGVLASGDLLKAIAQQYTENPDIVIQEDAVASVVGGNVFIRSSAGRVNLNVREQNEQMKSSFIKSISQKGRKLHVRFKSGKTYEYTSNNQAEFNRVADLLLTSTYVSHPFLENLRGNPDFQFTTL